MPSNVTSNIYPIFYCGLEGYSYLARGYMYLCVCVCVCVCVIRTKYVEMPALYYSTLVCMHINLICIRESVLVLLFFCSVRLD